MKKSILERVLDLFYPPRCAFCRRLLPDSEHGVCKRCLNTLPRTPAGSARDVKNTEFCVAPLLYEGTVRDSLLRYKFGGVTAYGRVYADFLAKCIDENGISCDIITWVPLSRKRLRRRGYDQARILAEETAKKLGLPCEKLLEKRIDNRPQSMVGDAEKRRANAKGVYVCTDPEKLKGRRVLLIDDIVTTGSTIAECASILKNAGCLAVYAAAAASRQ